MLEREADINLIEQTADILFGKRLTFRLLTNHEYSFLVVCGFHVFKSTRQKVQDCARDLKPRNFGHKVLEASYLRRLFVGEHDLEIYF